MYLFNFYYYSMYQEAKEHLKKQDPNSFAQKNIIFMVTIYLGLIVYFALVFSGGWSWIERQWPQEYLGGSKYNIFAPTAVLLFSIWYITGLILKKLIFTIGYVNSIKEKYNAVKIDFTNVGAVYYIVFVISLIFFILTFVIYKDIGFYVLFLTIIIAEIGMKNYVKRLVK